MLFGGALFMMFLEYVWNPSWLQKYKIQPGVSPASSDVAKAWIVAILNHIFIGGPLIYYTFPLWKGTAHGPLPDWQTFAFHMLVFVFVEDVLFYYSHRILHIPILYRPIHKMHHKFKAPVCIATTYAHPIEHLIANLIPLIAGPLIMNTHLFTMWSWMIYGLYSTLHSHSGFHFPGGSSATEHDIHHQLFNCNYGIGILDVIHGTRVNRVQDFKPKKSSW